MGNVRSALYDFVFQFVRPQVQPDCIIWGNQNNVTLPISSNDFIIYRIINSIRHGTNIETYDGENNTILESTELVVQFDCYCDSTNGEDGTQAMLRAKSLEVLFRSGIATRFFKDYDMSALYADDAKDTTSIGDSALMVYRWTITAHIIVPYRYTDSQDGFDRVTIKLKTSGDPGIADVDVFYR